MNRKIYTLSLYLLFPVIVFYFLYRGLKDTRYLRHLNERFGLITPKFSDSDSLTKTLIIHCASVGETKAVVPLIKKLYSKGKLDRLIITNTTPTGRAESEKLFQDLTSDKSNNITLENYYIPIDWPISCHIFLDKIKPDCLVLMETELWPNLINQCNKKDIPILLANARMSKKSVQKYNKHLKLKKEIFSGITHIAAQYESDMKNFFDLGVEQSKIDRVGSIKFNIHLGSPLIQSQKSLKELWSGNRPCWIACSIHPGELSTILNTHKKLLANIPNLLLIAIPRHPEQFQLFKTKVKESNMSFVSRSNNEAPAENIEIVIGDTMGELLLMCGVADVAFVGGSLINRGGHNPLEPSACGLPVIMGKSVFNFSDVSDIMKNHNTLKLISNEDQLVNEVTVQLKENNTSNIKKNIDTMFKQNGNALIKTVELIERYMK